MLAFVLANEWVAGLKLKVKIRVTKQRKGTYGNTAISAFYDISKTSLICFWFLRHFNFSLAFFKSLYFLSN